MQQGTEQELVRDGKGVFPGHTLRSTQNSESLSH